MYNGSVALHTTRCLFLLGSSEDTSKENLCVASAPADIEKNSARTALEAKPDVMWVLCQWNELTRKTVLCHMRQNSTSRLYCLLETCCMGKCVVFITNLAVEVRLSRVRRTVPGAAVPSRRPAALRWTSGLPPSRPGPDRAHPSHSVPLSSVLTCPLQPSEKDRGLPPPRQDCKAPSHGREAAWNCSGRENHTVSINWCRAAV